MSMVNANIQGMYVFYKLTHLSEILLILGNSPNWCGRMKESFHSIFMP